MNKLLILGVFMVASLGLSGCEEGRNVPGATLVGAGAGGLIGSQLFGGRSGPLLGALGGALVGGVIGGQVGRYMDRQDRANMRRAITTTPINSEASWTNPNNDVTYVVRPVRDYHTQGAYCREYQSRIKIGDEWKKGFGKACRMPDGQWRIAS